MLDGAACRAPRLSGDAQFSGLLRRAVAIFLANRLPMVAVRGFSRLHQGRPLCWRPRTATSLRQASFKAHQKRSKGPRQQPPTSNPLREGTSLLRANVGKFLKASASVLSTAGSRLISMRPERSIRHCICSNTVSRNNEESSSRLIAVNISSVTRLNTFHITP